MAIDLAQVTFSEALDHLKCNGWKEHEDWYDEKYDPRKRFHSIMVPDGVAVSDAQCYRDFGYALMSSDDYDDIGDIIGCIECGGMYTAMCSYDGENAKNMGMIHTKVPDGDQPLPNVTPHEVAKETLERLAGKPDLQVDLESFFKADLEEA